MYFVRVLIGHVHEALEIVQEIASSPLLMSAVDRCDAFVIEAFKTVELFTRDRKQMDMLRWMRSRASFHYDKQLPVRNLKKIADDFPDENWAYSMGSEALDWHFQLADAVMDRMVVRDIYGLDEPRSHERHEKLRVIAKQQQDIAFAFTTFAAHFVRHYSR